MWQNIRRVQLSALDFSVARQVIRQEEIPLA
jgi:hypothetical protein